MHPLLLFLCSHAKALTNITFENRTWTNETRQVLNITDDFLWMRNCQFIKCESDKRGGCVSAVGFEGGLSFKTVTFLECEADLGSVYADSTKNVTVVFSECRFIQCEYEATGCILIGVPHPRPKNIALEIID
jgi:hypothetical protein